MKFFSRETCELLQKAGCKSESGFFYNINGEIFKCSGDVATIDFDAVKRGNRLGPFYYAFGWFDLCGPSKQARENAKLWFGEHLICRDCLCTLEEGHEYSCRKSKILISIFTYHRHKIIDLPEDEVETYVLKTMVMK